MRIRSLSLRLCVSFALAAELNAQAGPWREHEVETRSFFQEAVQVVDLDGDEDLDIQGGFLWYENAAGDGSSWVRHAAAGSDFAVARDLDRDGDADLVWFDGQGVRWTENLDGSGPTLVHAPIFSPPSLFLGLALLVQDLDQDGDADVVSAALSGSPSSPNVILWHENTRGDASAWRTRVIQAPLSPVGTLSVADVDGDGDADVLSGENSVAGAPALAGTYAWYENDLAAGLAWRAHPMDGGIRASHRQVRAADVDGDGDTDALFSTDSEAAAAPNPLGWLENLAGDGSSWQRHVLSAASTSDAWREVLAPVDLDKDGDVDVLRASELGLGWYENLDHRGTSWNEAILFVGAPSQLCAVGDVDADGDLDVLALRRLVGSAQIRLSWYENETRITPYGSDVNPPRSLTLLSGAPSLGQTLIFGLDNPLGTQASGAWTYLSIATEPEEEFPAGDLLPNWGMAGHGAAGELLLAYSGGNPVKIVPGPPWPGPGTPAPIAIVVPNDPTLIGMDIFFQGVLVDSSASLGVRFGLTNALRVLLGP